MTEQKLKKKGYWDKDVKEIQDRQESGKFTAKRDFVLSHNGYYKEIKAGDDVSDVPPAYHENLKTEKVI